MAASNNSRTLVVKFFCEGFLKETLAKIHGAVSVNYLLAVPRHVEHAHRRANGCQLHCWIAGRRDVQAGLHPVDIVVLRYSRDLRWVWLVDVEWRQLRSGKNEVLVFFKECLRRRQSWPWAVSARATSAPVSRNPSSISLLRVSLNASGCSCSRAP
jgi:hypothetical protein